MPPQTYPIPPAPSTPLKSAFAAAPEPPKTLTAPAIPQKKPQDWLDSVGKIAKHVAMQSTGELAKQNGYTARDRAVGNDQLPGIQMIAKNDRAVRTAMQGQGAGLAQAPTREQAMEHFSQAIKPAIAKPIETLKAAGVEVSEYDKMKEDNPELPDGISDDDKAMLMLEMGLRIMSADPQGGLIGALGQAGLGTMGTWRETRAQRAAEKARVAERAEDRAFDREKMGRSEGLRREEIGLRREDMERSEAFQREKLDRDEAFQREKLDRVEALQRARMAAGGAAGGGGSGPAEQQLATWLAERRAGVEGRAATDQDYLDAFERIRMSRDNPNQRAGLVLRAYQTKADDMMDDRPSSEKMEEAAREVDAVLSGNLDALQGAAAAEPEGGGGWLDWILGGGEEAAGPEGDPAIAAPAQPSQPTQPAEAPQAPSKPIEAMSLEELGTLDPYSLSEEDKARAADRWDALNGG